MGSIREDHIGRRVVLTHAGRGTRSTGTYEGVRPSEHTGDPVHVFRGGDVNGVPQGVWAMPADAADEYRVAEDLFIHDSGEVACGRDGHGGQYLNAAVANDPGHDPFVYTPLGTWSRVEAREAERHGLACQGCR